MTASDQNQAGASGVLYVVATPIGNLADMVPRAIEALQTVTLIAAEDTRHSSRLLAHFDIKTPCVAYHDHSDETRTRALVDRLLAGDSIALISDAGTPLVSDPGYRLVRQARLDGVRVVPIPGACAMVAALSAAGLASDRFAFEGFLPAKQAARVAQLQSLVNDSRTLIFYEAPHRILETLEDMCEVFGPERELVVAREVTKTFETIRGDKLPAMRDWVAADSNQQRGEIVLLLQGAPKRELAEITPEQEHVMQVLLEELPLKQAAAIGARLTGLKKNFLYQWALDKTGRE
ncbi:16S rRNA (cytidine(1402)-2'-O)-methyltransferase [Cellvibrio japonicus]|nr:16S rRNA (cytidine(1402)-2'-O)-methyltransferase [Cellvibrio japonicus]QEI11562.1 16S rRNA (cytidine(1402)-2'-O)-methyltransferase [Cellvibrio japonicus]QEI15136.1 16S rRNA (cytidine(1402)-2'-O)-methyltransferase [Cellvibrio japonicus]QEI18716.1 16S rRNA (cytidine(1402)-2'-O)-methyltransferase [Cellvibrio japonicus]